MSLLSQDGQYAQARISNSKSFIRGNMRAVSTSGYMTSILTPRFGVLSLLCESIPIYAYDNEKFCERAPKTAFTDGANVFVNREFVDEMYKDGNDIGANVLTFVMLHELMHVMCRHTTRLKYMDKQLANIAMDLYINSRLLLDIPEKMAKLVRSHSDSKNWFGFKPGDEKYATMSAEAIARELQKEKDKNPQENQEGDPNGKPQKGGTPGKGQKGQKGQNQSESESGEKSDSDDGDGGIMGDDHVMSIEDLKKILRQINEQGVMKALDIESAESVEKVEKAVENDLGAIANKIQTLKARLEQEGARLPGAATGQVLTEYIGTLCASETDWKVQAQELLIGSGMGRKYALDHICQEYFIDPMLIGSGSRIWIGADGPAENNDVCLVMLDTSGSMSKENLNECLTEIMAILTNNKNNAPEVAIFYSDTDVIGDPIIVNSQNVVQVMDDFSNGTLGINGRGGTDLLKGINNILGSDYVKGCMQNQKHVSSFLCFTDEGDTPPMKDNITGRIPQIFSYFVPSGVRTDQAFENAVSDYATVVKINGLTSNNDEQHERCRV